MVPLVIFGSSWVLWGLVVPWRAAAVVWLRWWRCSAAAGERSSGLARWDRARLRRFTHWAVAVPGAVAPEWAPRLQGLARGLGGGACVGGSHGSGRPVLTPRPGQDGAESLSMFLCERVRSEMGVDSVGVGGGEPGGVRGRCAPVGGDPPRRRVHPLALREWAGVFFSLARSAARRSTGVADPPATAV